MIETRTYVRKLLNTVEYMKERALHFQEDLEALSHPTDYDNTLKHYEDLIQTLKAKLKAIPVGYRYTGTYFLKKPYTMPAQFEERTGSLYVSENLVSWQIEETPGFIKDYRCYRSVYKAPFGELITKKDGEPVYEAD